MAETLVPCGQQIAWSTYALWMQGESSIPVLETVLPPNQTGSTCGGGPAGAGTLAHSVPLIGVWQVAGTQQAVSAADQTAEAGSAGAETEGAAVAGAAASPDAGGVETGTAGSEPGSAGTETGTAGSEGTAGAEGGSPGTQQAEPVVLTEAESLLLELVNAERTKHGLATLALDSRLVRTARAKSADMVTNNYFSHTSPTLGSPFDQMEAAAIPYKSAAENLAASSSVTAAHQTLMISSLHRGNLLNPKFTRIGIGVVRGGPYGVMVTQHFVGE